MTNNAPPAKATDAVLVPSDPVPAGVEEVRGIDWAGLPVESRSVIANFVVNLSQQGFQSSSIGDAIRIVNDMVCLVESEACGSSDCFRSANGRTLKHTRAQQSFLAILLT